MLLADVGADIELDRDTNLYRIIEKELNFFKNIFLLKNCLFKIQKNAVSQKTPTFVHE